MTQLEADASDVHVFSVSELNRTVRDVLEAALGPVWVAGELSNIARPASGHIYFTLKDADAQVRCAMFRGRNRRLTFTPAAGMQVRAYARVGLYEARGDYQLVVEAVEPGGAGALAQAFEALKKRLAAEGLFAAERKRALPAWPQRIGVVTSAAGAAVRDVLRVLRRRFPAIPVVIYPVPVQGDKAAPEIARMIERAGQRGECDLLLVVRGGGSLEDLWAFNEEAVARAIVASPVPVVSGIGHEVDVTIADFAADRRAPTPSAAAEAVAPEAETIERHVLQLQRRLVGAARTALARMADERGRLERRLHRQHPARRLLQLHQRGDELAARLARAQRRDLARHRERVTRLEKRLRRAAPSHRIQRECARTDRAELALRRAVSRALAHRGERLGSAVRALEAVSPLAVLGRGYALVQRAADGRPVTEARQATPGEGLDVRLAKGRLEATVDRADSGETEA
jgi:exodeoxyribonuclease VII large subunit